MAILNRFAPIALFLGAGLAPVFAPGRAPNQAPKTTQRDPQAAYEPRSGPGAGQAFLERLAGDWEVLKIFYPRSGAPNQTKGECRQAMMHDGRFLRADFVFDDANRKTTGL